MSNLRIGLPSKGRLADQAADLLGQAGLKFRRQNRSLFARISEFPIDISNVQVYSEKAGKGVRTKIELVDGKRVRVGIPCGTRFD